MNTIIKNKNTISKKDSIIILSNKKTKISNIELSKDEKTTRLHNLHRRNMYSIFMKEYDDKLSVLLRIKKSLIMI